MKRGMGGNGDVISRMIKRFDKDFRDGRNRQTREGEERYLGDGARGKERGGREGGKRRVETVIGRFD